MCALSQNAQDKSTLFVQKDKALTMTLATFVQLKVQTPSGAGGVEEVFACSPLHASKGHCIFISTVILSL